jgi:hypothetical protein
MIDQNLPCGRKEARMNRLHKGSVFLAAGVLSAFLGRDAVADGPFQYYALTPCRVVDTRSANPSLAQGGIVAVATNRSFTMQGRCGVPLGAKAVTLNLTITQPTQGGFISLYPAGPLPSPMISTINFLAGEPGIANGAIVPLAATTPDLGLIFGSSPGSWTTHVVIDVTGYFAGP